jgi:hypothetical protein
MGHAANLGCECSGGSALLRQPGGRTRRVECNGPPPGKGVAQNEEILYPREVARLLAANPIQETFMAEKPKLTKATAKPTKTSTRKTVSAAAKPVTPSHEEIKRLAEKYWAARGFPHGTAEQDWLRAEQELRQKAS